MKKCVLLCLLALCLLSACAGEPAPVNEIVSVKLTQEQIELVDLLQNSELEILFFDFKTDDAFRTMEFWVEVYEYGVLKDRPSGVQTSNDKPLTRKGRLAVIVNHGSETQWTFTLSQDGSKFLHDGTYDRGEAFLGRAYGPIDEAIPVESGKEIVLYSCIFSNGPIATYSDQQIYLEQPELLDRYPLTYLIKCRFDA